MWEGVQTCYNFIAPLKKLTKSVYSESEEDR